MSDERAGSVLVGGLLAAAIAFGVGFVVAFAMNAGTGWFGLTLAGAMGCTGVALGVWAHRLADEGEVTHDRPRYGPASDDDVQTAAGAAARGAAPVLGRRALTGLLAAAGGTLVVALLAPLTSLGPAPITAVGSAWRRGRRVVDADGRPVRAEDLQQGEVLTVFPEGVEQRADDQVLLLALPPDSIRAVAGREGWSPEGLTAYSKVCTHAGCPVGLYQQERQRLVCPCHQASFDVLDGARPVFGPAPVALPQLPLRIAADGALEADGPLSGQVGPRGWWSGGDQA